VRRHAQRIIPLIPRSVGDIASAQPMQCWRYCENIRFNDRRTVSVLG